jgi:hypothetical protein
MAELSLDHFFNVVCHKSLWVHVKNDEANDLLRRAIIHLVTTSTQYPRLHRAAEAWQPDTPVHRKFKRLMLAKDLQPLARDQLTPEVMALMRTLQDWLRTNWYLKGEIPRARSKLDKQYGIKTLQEQRILLARKRAMNVEQRRPNRG